MPLNLILFLFCHILLPMNAYITITKQRAETCYDVCVERVKTATANSNYQEGV
jgi:hypothetical protein